MISAIKHSFAQPIAINIDSRYHALNIPIIEYQQTLKYIYIHFNYRDS